MSEDATVQPFVLDELGRDVFARSYGITEDETWTQGSRRVAEWNATAEDPDKRSRYAERFYRQIVEGRLMPGGRIFYAAGRPKAQGLNCFVIDIADSREGWGQMLKESLIISGTGGGVGINFSPVRPRGSDIKGTGGTATGPVSVMKMDNSVGHELMAGGGRRMAKMFALAVTHPDLPEFLNCKLVDGELSNANISVIMDMDPAKFVDLVENDGDIEFEWGGRKTGNSIKASEVWKTIVENAWNNGEPGVLNQYLANQMNNIYYKQELICTNPCGEIWLEKNGCCCLGAIVLSRFVEDGIVDWEGLEETVRLGVRFLDNVLTINHYPFEEIKLNCEQNRRIGLGVMGLHTMLLKIGVRYSSKAALEFTDKLFNFIKNAAYDTSINLAIEKGPFPGFDKRFVDSGFMKTMKPAIRRKVLEYGIRNCALLTVAPTGTTGMVQGVSTGIEPYMAPVYWRTIVKDMDRKREKVLVIEPVYDEFPDIIEGAADLHPRQHFDMQKVVQKHIDNAVSKTINLPSDYPIEDLAALWLEYLPHVKGSTFYRWGSRENEPFSPVRKEDIESVLFSTPEEQIRRKVKTEDNDALCVSGVCEVDFSPKTLELVAA